MAGSRSETSLVLLHDYTTGITTWAIKSAARLAKIAQPYKYFIVWETDPDYAGYEKAAGPKPEILVEEVSQPKQGVDNETQEDSE